MLVDVSSSMYLGDLLPGNCINTTYISLKAGILIVNQALLVQWLGSFSSKEGARVRFADNATRKFSLFLVGFLSFA
jgi:uncharacterized membrane protein